MICAISGKIGSGKDTFCSMLKAAIIEAKLPKSWKKLVAPNPWTHEDQLLEHFSGYQTKRWAGTLKQIVAILIGCTVEQLEDRKFKDSYLGEEWWYWEHKYERGIRRQTLSDAPDYRDKNNWVEFRPTVRQLLQEVGTDAIRNVIHPNAWVNALMNQYKAYPKGEAHDLKDFRELYHHKECKNCKKSYSGWKRQYLCKECIEDDTVQFYSDWIIPDTRFPNEADAVKQRGGLVIRINRPFIEQGKVVRLAASHPSETGLDNYQHFDEVIQNDGSLEELYTKAKQIVQKYGLHK